MTRYMVVVDQKTIVKMSIVSKLVPAFNAVTVKSSSRFFGEIDKLIWKFIWKCIGARLAKTIWKKNLENFYYLILRLTTKLLYSRHCGISIKIYRLMGHSWENLPIYMCISHRCQGNIIGKQYSFQQIAY